MEPERQSVRLWVTDAIFIALITASAYFWAHQYEIGWYKHFQIPYQFISLNLTNILSISGSINFIFAMLFLPCLLIILSWNSIIRFLYEFDNKHPIVFACLAQIIILVGFILLLIIYREQTFWFWVIIPFLVLFNIFLFGSPLISQRGKGRYWDKFKASRKAHMGPEPVNVQFSPVIVNALVICVILSWIWLGTYLSFQGGQYYAKHQQVFSVIATQYPGVQEVVVLRTYGDYFLTVPFDRLSKEVEKKIYLLKISEMSDKPLISEKVGPLRVKP